MAAKQLVPIAFKKEISKGHKPIHILAADIGGTKANIALYSADAEGLTLVNQKDIFRKIIVR